MTSSPAPTPTPRSSSLTSEPLNPLRYHAMINPARIREPARPVRSGRRWPAIALLGLGAILVAVGVAVGPIVAGLLAG
jgi:hypothetical protein